MAKMVGLRFGFY